MAGPADGHDGAKLFLAGPVAIVRAEIHLELLVSGDDHRHPNGVNLATVIEVELDAMLVLT